MIQRALKNHLLLQYSYSGHSTALKPERSFQKQQRPIRAATPEKNHHLKHQSVLNIYLFAIRFLEIQFIRDRSSRGFEHVRLGLVVADHRHLDITSEKLGWKKWIKMWT